MPTEEELIARAAELLARGPLLPPPAERKRLREAAGLRQEDVAIALETKRETVNGWETGRTMPRPPRLAAYKHLLDGWAAQYPASPGNANAPSDVTAAPQTFTGAPAPAEARTLSAAPASVSENTPPRPTTDTVAAPAAAVSPPARTARPSSTSRRPGGHRPAL
ncbi:hypothetical protein AQJ91_47995 [Streptomyces dysideae]|uniref:HTH cro/C1-type domain-containing protein n=1 Tax=Streptomyces dysideae TaxID=909626 RepID=A0A124ICK5_9ACTN|nr:hypothetical protein AQJ91_47995 [Streptomyces dysideae]